jgi:cytochrome b561
VALRLIYRCVHRPLPLPDDIAPMQRLAAEATHWALYALLVLQPLIGRTATSAYPAPVPFFGAMKPVGIMNRIRTAVIQCRARAVTV